ncbi:hypothetical protein [Phenylobacterium sp.]|jgi:hypothetical protein|uniref:hypothetical protein n=1 Tax=Phenylobacterium sp. TaxID=1871053 RepID=UPI002E2ECE44|nr:hypothetical protein [Phenylobacterium sp.]HEX3367125.1 hypothetical protein [Phenylobacterium sp.]
MTRAFLPILAVLTLGLAACETAEPNGGAADYDALKRAQADCAAQGGKLVLKDQGDAQRIDAYTCKRT